MGVGQKEEMLNSLLFGEGQQNNYDGVYDYFMRWIINMHPKIWVIFSETKRCLPINFIDFMVMFLTGFDPVILAFLK